VFGSGDVDRVVWHAAPFAGEVVAATFQNERDAAVGTLRRQAFTRGYRPRFEGTVDGDSVDDGDGDSVDDGDGDSVDDGDGDSVGE
jgi:hypothetical protein